MFSLVLNVLILLVVVWSYQRRRLYDWLERRWDEDRVDRLKGKDYTITQTVLGFLLVLSCFNFIFIRPDGMPLWVPVTLIGLLVMYRYRDVLVRFAVFLKEPFKKLDKRDLKWRMGMRWNHVVNELRFNHTTTWNLIIMSGRLFICSVFKHRWADWETVKYVGGERSRKCSVCHAVHTKRGEEERYHDGHNSHWPEIRDSYAVFKRHAGVDK